MGKNLSRVGWPRDFPSSSFICPNFSACACSESCSGSWETSPHKTKSRWKGVWKCGNFAFFFGSLPPETPLFFLNAFWVSQFIARQVGCPAIQNIPASDLCPMLWLPLSLCGRLGWKKRMDKLLHMNGSQVKLHQRWHFVAARAAHLSPCLWGGTWAAAVWRQMLLGTRVNKAESWILSFC